MDDGVEHLESVLCDLVRNGLSQDEVSRPSFWEDLARRLVDAQAGGLAGHVRGLGELPHAGHDWEGHMLRELGTLHALLTAYRRRESLDPDLRAEVEQLVGWTSDKEEILKGKGVADRWFVAARKQTERDRLVTSATWLYGYESARWALVLRFAAEPSRPAEPWPLGSEVHTEMVFYPGAAPDRALPRNETAAARLVEEIPEPEGGFLELLESYAAALAVNPWRARRPFLVSARPARHHDWPVLVDDSGSALPWWASGEDEDLLTSISGGRPITLCGEWNGRHLTVHSATDAGSWFALHSPAA